MIHDKKQGTGVMNYNNNSKFEGEWQNDSQFVGTFVYNTNNLSHFYNGEFTNGKI